MNVSASSDYFGEGRVTQRDQNKLYIDRITFNPQDNVLDVGCGSGAETILIAAKVCSITGIDPSDEMLAVARKLNSAANISYYKDKAETVGDKFEWRENFDKVVCLQCLHWIADRREALRSIAACLKPGGEALFIVGNRNPFEVDADLFLRSHIKWGKYVKDFTLRVFHLNRSPLECRELWLECGWEEADCEEVEYDRSHRNELQIKLFFKTIFRQSSLIPEEEQAEYMDDLWRWALSKYPDNVYDNQFKLPIYSMIIHACK